MSSPSKRPSAIGTSHSDSESTKITPMKPPAAPTTMLASFIHLLGCPGAEADAEITRIFSEWGVNSWVDRACFVVDDMEKFIVASESVALRPQRLRKQLGFLVEYARLGHDVVAPTGAVDEYHAAPHKSDPCPPTSPPCEPTPREEDHSRSEGVYWDSRGLFFLAGLHCE